MKVLSDESIRVTPYLTFNGVVKLMSASSAKDREKLLSDYKYPEPEGNAQGTYYGAARDGIRKYHAANNDRSVTDAILKSLESLYSGANWAKTAKLDNNIRALTSYLGNFGNRKFVPLDGERLLIDCEGVTLNLHPDFVATEGKRTRIVRYAFSQKGVTDDEIRFSLQLLSFYARNVGLEVQNADCQLLIVSDGSVRTLTGVSTRFEPNLKSAMREVRRNWGDI